jgi:hypothetical protein
MQQILLASGIVLLSMAASAEPSKPCRDNLQVATKTCQTAQRVAWKNICICTTQAGNVCSGPCYASGRPFGCSCK